MVEKWPKRSGEVELAVKPTMVAAAPRPAVAGVLRGWWRTRGRGRQWGCSRRLESRGGGVGKGLTTRGWQWPFN
jgi:hypothetical protein